MSEEGEIEDCQNPGILAENVKSEPKQPVFKKPRMATTPPLVQNLYPNMSWLNLPWQGMGRTKLNFNCWMKMQADDDCSRHHLLAQDFQRGVLDVLLSCKSRLGHEFRYLDDNTIMDYKVKHEKDTRMPQLCIVALQGCHPGFLSDQVESSEDFQFFTGDCSSLPCRLKRTKDKKEIESPVAEWLFSFDGAEVDSSMLTAHEMFYEHELMYEVFSTCWAGAITLRPDGYFYRHNHDDEGVWTLKGEELHLNWDKHGVEIVQCVDSSYHRMEVAPSEEEHQDKFDMNLVKCCKAQQVQNVIETAPNVSHTVVEQPFEYYLMNQRERIKFEIPMHMSVEEKKLRMISDGKNTDCFIQFREPKGSVLEDNVYALDCEMVLCKNEMFELARVTVVNYSGEVVYDTLVQPSSAIVNYHTEYSGITEEMLTPVDTRLADVQHHLQKIFFSDTILIGHSMNSDLRALRVLHDRIIDTSILYPHPRGFPFKLGLKMLYAQYLNKTIQDDSAIGHDSTEDARAALELFKLKRANPPSFGIPQPSKRRNIDYNETLLDRMAVHCPDRKIAFHHLQTTVFPSESKPWHQATSIRIIDYPLHTWLAKHLDKSSPKTNMVSSLHQHDNLDSFTNQVAEAFKSRSGLIQFLQLDASVPDAIDELDLFLHSKTKWETWQQEWIKTVDLKLSQIAKSMAKNSIILVVPQNHLEALDHLRGLRIQSNWKDTQTVWRTVHKSGLFDLRSGAMDSFIVCKQIN